MADDLKRVEVRHVGEKDGDIRLDRWFKRHYPNLPFGRLAKLLRTGQIRVDGRRAKAGQHVRPGQEIRVPPLPADAGASRSRGEGASAPDEAETERLRGAVLYRDDWLLAINKPAGLATQGGTGVRRHLDAMLEALRFDAPEPPRLVHRLDRDTSGVLLLGRSADAASRLAQAFRSTSAHKLYWALTAAAPHPAAGRIDMALAKVKRGGGERMGADPATGKPATTLYRTIAVADAPCRAAWVALRPLTGRTHQLRAHLVAIGAPILGDGKYGGRQAFPGGLEIHQLQLHAREIALPHPADGTTLRITAPLPPHMASALAALGFDPEDGVGIEPDDG